MILQSRINAEAFTGVHVPLTVPQKLIDTQADYFAKPGEQRGLP